MQLIKYFCPPQIRMLEHSSQYGGIWGLVLWEGIKMQGWGPYEWD